MALTDFRREIALIAVSATAPRGFAVGGDLGLQLHGFGDRPTGDLDSYTTAFEIEVFDDTADAPHAAFLRQRLGPAVQVRGLGGVPDGTVPSALSATAPHSHPVHLWA
ncbi:MAG: hypothetical protein LBJ02_09520 [Bifidobacteriaceae bacterium]|nr:hypothetical protein [Bifidobacteriaceae bacterium]